MSSSYHKSLEVFTEVWMRTPILLKCDVASPITQWHSITDQKNSHPSEMWCCITNYSVTQHHRPEELPTFWNVMLHHQLLSDTASQTRRTPILLKCDVASPITQWHSIIDQKNKSPVPVIMTAFCVHLDIPIHWGSPGFMLNRYVFPAKKGTLRCQGLEWPGQTFRVLSSGMQVSKYIYSLFNDNQ